MIRGTGASCSSCLAAFSNSSKRSSASDLSTFLAASLVGFRLEDRMECFLVAVGAVAVLLLELLEERSDVLEPFLELPVETGLKIFGEGELAAGFSQLEKKSSTLLFLEELTDEEPDEVSAASSSAESTISPG